MEKQLGGQRLGSGNKNREMTVSLHNYERSTFNQSRKWMSTMACGTLVPFFHEIGTNGDKFDIDLSLMCRTLPTIAPLFGNFKLQLDMFAIPVRLYNGLLHNNAVKIGLHMDQVLFPKLKINFNNHMSKYAEDPHYFAHPSSLMAYLGQRSTHSSTVNNIKSIELNALSLLAYYDIYKNYYANKQENTAYFVGAPNNQVNKFTINTYSITTSVKHKDGTEEYYSKPASSAFLSNDMKLVSGDLVTQQIYITESDLNTILANLGDNLSTNNLSNLFKEITVTEGNPFLSCVQLHNIKIGNTKSTVKPPIISEEEAEFRNTPLAEFEYKRRLTLEANKNCVSYGYYVNLTYYVLKDFNVNDMGGKLDFTGAGKFGIQSFPLENIDTMRIDILKNTGLGKTVTVDSQTYLPYGAISKVFDKETVISDKTYKLGQSYNALPMYGLAIKTYQSDINNNWLNAGDVLNYVTKASEVQVVDNKFDIDALIMAKKVYNLLNRIVVSGSTWTDWQEAVYSENAVTRAEQPIYVGGMSADIMFEEVVATNSESLGQLAGKGNITNVQGGHVVVNCNEPMLIMGIASITPRIAYSQNNWWFNSLGNLDELHKPAFDGISFQDKLLSDFIPYVDFTDNTGVLHQKAIGKQPAWLHYMTAVDEIYGSFAIDTELNYMTLDRRYVPEFTKAYDDATIQDATTYIDPSRYLYAFQGQRLEDAQVFWLQVGVDCYSRRKMSAKQMPQL